MAFNYLDPDVQYRNRFDLDRFVAFREVMYDDFDSFFLQEFRALPAQGVYTITRIEGRPDVYSRDIYNNTDYWMLLLIYNNIVDIGALKIGVDLSYPYLNSLESVYLRLQSRI